MCIFPLFTISSCQDKEEALTVINVYCPRADPEKPERKQFKLHFYQLLQRRAEALLKDGRWEFVQPPTHRKSICLQLCHPSFEVLLHLFFSHVIVLGDINTSHQRIDHCDPSDKVSK